MIEFPALIFAILSLCVIFPFAANPDQNEPQIRNDADPDSLLCTVKQNKIVLVFALYPDQDEETFPDLAN